MSRMGMAAVTLVVACGLSTANDAVKVSVQPTQASEGLPTSFEVVVTCAGQATLAVSEVRIALGTTTQSHTLSRHLRGAWGEPAAEGAVTVELEISEGDIGPIARAPMPSVHVPCGPDAFVTYRLLKPGGELRFTLRAIPLACRPADIHVEVDCFPLDGLVEGLNAAQYPKGSAEASVSLGEPQSGSFPGPGSATLRCQAWGPSAGEAEEVLLGSVIAELMPTLPEPVDVAVQVAPAPVPCSDALATGKTAAEELDDAVWLADIESWVLETKKGSLVVPKGGEPRSHKGRLAELAARMTEGGPVELTAPSDEALRAELEEKGVRTSEGKMLLVQARAAHLGTILDAIEKRGLVIQGQYVTEAPPEGPATEPPPMEQGTEIECIDCTVIRPGYVDCPTCKGTGHRFQPARMMDEAGQRSLAVERRAKVDALVAKAKTLEGEASHEAWHEAAVEMRVALTDLLVYGDAWATGWANRDAVPSHPDMRAAWIDLLKAQLRHDILDAEGRLGAR